MKVIVFKMFLVTQLLSCLFMLSPIFAEVDHAAASKDVSALTSGWEKIDEDDGITVWKKELKGSDVVAFKGETTINASIAKVANVLIDTSRKKEWVAKLEEAKDVRYISDYEHVEYNHTASGFILVRDRDFVFKATAKLDKPARSIYIDIRSVKDDLMPETGKVRGEIVEGTYILTASDDLKKTKISVALAVDPKGNIPKFVVNLFQKAWPHKTLEGIQKQCEKSDVKEHEKVKAFFST